MIVLTINSFVMTKIIIYLSSFFLHTAVSPGDGTYRMIFLHWFWIFSRFMFELRFSTCQA
jgi:hypothetical protein